VLVTGIAIGLPLLHFVPQGFNWMTRRRLLHWYAQLKALETSFESNPSHRHLIDKQAEIERIEEALSKIQFPLNFSDQVYNLRSHIDIVRRKIESRLHSYGRVAAE
jgi:methionine-rich copper-binding protein CopC